MSEDFNAGKKSFISPPFLPKDKSGYSYKHVNNPFPHSCILLYVLYSFILQGSANRGPRAIRGPPRVSEWPARPFWLCTVCMFVTNKTVKRVARGAVLKGGGWPAGKN